MYKFMIVDNEKIIVDGLVGYFKELQETLDLEVFGAYSGRQAISLMEQAKYDVVLSDIRMPGMSGLELQEEINLRWPRCEVIFLSGYDEFAYVQQAVRGGASNYILKTEGYEVIVDTVTAVLEKLKQAIQLDDILANAQKRWKSSLPLLQKECMRDLLLGEPMRNLKHHFEELHIDLGYEQPALLIIGRVDEWIGISMPSDRALLTFAIQNIAEEFFHPSVRLYSFAFEPSRIVWLIQPMDVPNLEQGEELERRALRFVQQTLADIQSACKKLLNIVVSFALAGSFAPWDRMAEQFESLKLLFNLGLGTRKETILLELHNVESPEIETEQAKKLQPVVSIIRKLQSHLENGERGEFFNLYKDLMSEGITSSPLQDTKRLEIALSLAGMFLSAINRWQLHQEMSKMIDITMFSRLDYINAWKDCESYFNRITEALFEAKSNRRVYQENDIIVRINNYVSVHLADDLSLSKIGDAFGHHPYYLSRLYKQITKVGLFDFITETRLMKAKELLQNSDLKIQDISKAVGFISHAYFYRFFKKSTNVTPQEFRDSGI